MPKPHAGVSPRHGRVDPAPGLHAGQSVRKAGTQRTRPLLPAGTAKPFPLGSADDTGGTAPYALERAGAGQVLALQRPQRIEDLWPELGVGAE